MRLTHADANDRGIYSRCNDIRYIIGYIDYIAIAIHSIYIHLID